MGWESEFNDSPSGFSRYCNSASDVLLACLATVITATAQPPPVSFSHNNSGLSAVQPPVRPMRPVLRSLATPGCVLLTDAGVNTLSTAMETWQSSVSNNDDGDGDGEDTGTGTPGEDAHTTSEVADTNRAASGWGKGNTDTDTDADADSSSAPGANTDMDVDDNITNSNANNNNDDSGNGNGNDNDAQSNTAAVPVPVYGLELLNFNGCRSLSSPALMRLCSTSISSLTALNLRGLDVGDEIVLLLAPSVWVCGVWVCMWVCMVVCMSFGGGHGDVTYQRVCPLNTAAAAAFFSHSLRAV